MADSPTNDNDAAAMFADLLQRLEQGDTTARDALIERSQQRLRIRVSQMLSRFPGVRRICTTSDVLQEVLLDLSGTLQQITPRNGRHFMGLAGQRIRWTLLDLARRRPQAYQPTDGCLADLIDTTHDPVRFAAWADIHAYIEALPDDEREMFNLIFYEDVPLTVVARMLGMPPRTLRHHWQAARLRFMQRFDGTVF